MKDLNLIRKVAWSFSKTTGQEFDELFAEASLAYVEAVQTYNPEKALLSTWAVKVMTNQLITFCKKEKEYINFSEFFDDNLLAQEDQEKDYFFKEWIRDLPQDLQLICKIIFDAPEEFLTKYPKISRGKLAKKLRCMEWSWPRIWDSIRNMKTTLNKNKHISII